MRAAIFDLDGTLADTAPDLVGALNDMMADEGMPLVDPVETRRTAGMGGRALIRHGWAAAGVDLAETQIDALYPVFLKHYKAREDRDSFLFDGVLETLDRLAALGWRLGVCTNKPHELAGPVLSRLGVAGRFEVVLGSGAVSVGGAPVRKPHPRHLLSVIEALGADPRRSVLVGDTKTDRDAARNAGAPVVLMTFGYALEPLESLGPDAILADFAGLPPVLDRLCPAGA